MHGHMAPTPYPSRRNAFHTVSYTPRYPISPAVALLMLVCCAHVARALPALHAWRECSSQAVFGGMYGAQALANLTEFR